MAWEDRNGRKYFYLSQRDGHKIRKIYVGCGEAGRTAELALECRSDQRRAVRDWLRDAATKFEELDKIDAELTVGLAAVMYAECGIRLDARAARRIIRKQGAMVMGETVRETSLSPEERETWQRLCELASRGDREAAAALLPFLEKHPLLKERWGDLSRRALGQWLGLIAGRDEVTLQATRSKVLKLVESLRRDAADPLEELLARRVGLQWLQAHYVDVQLGLAVSRTHEEQEFLARRQQATQQTYTGAVRALQEYQLRGNTPPRTPARKPAPR